MATPKTASATPRPTARRALGKRPDRGRAQRPHADHLRPDRTRTPASSTSRRPSPPAKSSSSSRIASANGSGRTRTAPQRLARDYNDTFNNLRLRTYDGSHLTFPGMNREHLRNNDLDKHQKDAVWRILQSDNTLLAHCRGCRQDLEMIAAAMEMRRLGLAQKADDRRAQSSGRAMGRGVPAALSAGAYLRRRQRAFAAGNRQKAMSRIATGNYDAVIVSHSSFEILPGIGRDVQPLRRATDRRSWKRPSAKPRPRRATTAAS